MEWAINLFQTKRGEFPVKDFIEKQDFSIKIKIERYITLLKISGPFLKPPFMKKIQNKLYELRIVGKEQIRIFYTKNNESYYLLHAFKKKSQKTPSKEIKTAVDRMKEIR
jgi:phage-related protein